MKTGVIQDYTIFESLNVCREIWTEYFLRSQHILGGIDKVVEVDEVLPVTGNKNWVRPTSKIGFHGVWC